MAYDPNGLLAEKGRDEAFAALSLLLGKIAPIAHTYDAVVAEGYGATVPTVGVNALVTAARVQRGLVPPLAGHIKSSSGPASVYPRQLSDASSPRCLLVTEQVHRGFSVQWALLELRGALPPDSRVDVAVLADKGRAGLDIISRSQLNGEQLHVGVNNSLDGNYFFYSHDHQGADGDEALRLGQIMAEQFIY